MLRMDLHHTSRRRIFWAPLLTLAIVAHGASGMAGPSTGSGGGGAPDPEPHVRCGGVTEVRVLGQYGRFSGTIELRSPVGIGGEAPPAGAYLVLDAPLRALDASGRTSPESCFAEVYVEGREDLIEGEQLELQGRLDRTPYGGVETPARSLLSISGVTVSDVRASSPVARPIEPTYDGHDFRNRAGEILPQLTYRRPLIRDLPATILVLDETSRLAFVGTMGGFISPERNPFHGFRVTAPLEAPTEADRAAVRFEGDSAVSAASGEPLEAIGVIAPEVPHPDALTERWYFDESTSTAYGFLYGGIAGFHNELARVIRVP